MSIMAKKKKTPKRRAVTPPPTPTKHNLSRPPSRLEGGKHFEIARKIWKASQGQEPIIHHYRRKEAVSWALVAARLEAEQTATHGGSFADCLRSAIKELEAQLHFLGEKDGDGD